ncbi:hypothetical protein LRP88_13387 [Fusarium phalaenopsidis]
MLSDIFTASALHTDTIRIFPQAMGMWCRGENKQWIPEQIFPEKKKNEVIAPMSVSQEFLVPDEQTDVRSLTSHGHFIHHQAPAEIGLGWDWKPKFDEEFTFVLDSEDPSVEIMGDTVLAEPASEEAQPATQNGWGRRRASNWDGAPQTLYQKFNPGSRPNNQREVAQTSSVETGAKEEEIKVKAIEEEEVGVEDEETSSHTPYGRCTTMRRSPPTSLLQTYRQLPNGIPLYTAPTSIQRTTLGSSVAGQTTMLLCLYA